MIGNLKVILSDIPTRAFHFYTCKNRHSTKIAFDYIYTITNIRLTFRYKESFGLHAIFSSTVFSRISFQPIQSNLLFMERRYHQMVSVRISLIQINLNAIANWIRTCTRIHDSSLSWVSALQDYGAALICIHSKGFRWCQRRTFFSLVVFICVHEIWMSIYIDWIASNGSGKQKEILLFDHIERRGDIRGSFIASLYGKWILYCMSFIAKYFGGTCIMYDISI